MWRDACRGGEVEWLRRGGGREAALVGRLCGVLIGRLVTMVEPCGCRCSRASGPVERTMRGCASRPDDSSVAEGRVSKSATR